MEDLALTPVDIRHKEFSTALAGYKKEEVREFLNLISNQLEDIQLSGAKLFDDTNVQEVIREEPVVQEKPVQAQPEPTPPPKPQVAASEDLIGRTLVMAEEMKMKIISEAKQQAAAIISEAEQKVEVLLREATDYQNTMESELTDLKDRKKDFLMNFRAELIEWLEKIEQDPVFDKDREMKVEKEKLNRNLINEVRNLKNELTETEKTESLQEEETQETTNTEQSEINSNLQFDDDEVQEETQEQYETPQEEEEEDISLEAIFGISDKKAEKSFDDSLTEELSNAIDETLNNSESLINEHEDQEEEKTQSEPESNDQNKNKNEEDFEDDLQFEEHEPLFKD